MKQTLATILLLALYTVSAAQAETSGGIDWSGWERMPVLHEGRIMPLDTVAIIEVRKICGTVRPEIGMLGALSMAETERLSSGERKTIASEGKPRAFSAAELLYAWTIDPAKWDAVPFIRCEDEELRASILEVPIYGEDDTRLKYVSPKQVRESRKFREQIDELRRQQDDHPKDPLTPLGTRVKDLYEAFVTYEQLVFDPNLPGMGRPQAGESVGMLVQEWFGLEQDLPRLPGLEQVDGITSSIQETSSAIRAMGTVWLAGEDTREPLIKLEPLWVRVRNATTSLADRVADKITAAGDGKDPLRIAKRNLVDRSASVARLAVEFHWSMFESGGSLRVLPSMEPSSLEVDRYRSDVQPWISLPAVLYGSNELLHDYPARQIEAARQAWQEARDAYNAHAPESERSSANRGVAFAAAMQSFTQSLRSIADDTKTARESLPLKEDHSLIPKTAYPDAILMEAEYVYNQIDPFFWAWCVALGSAAMIGLSFVVSRKFMFWCGISALAGAIGCIAFGFLMRMFITRWAPVTSMFETIVWVTMCVSLLTLWLTFLPMLGSSSRTAWRLTAIPLSWEKGPGDENQNNLSQMNVMPMDGKTPSGFETLGLALARSLALATRLLVFLIAMYVAGVFPTPGETPGYRLVALAPRVDIGSTLPNVNSTLVWGASLFVACTLIWFIPRLVPTAIGSVLISLYRLATEDCREPMERVYRSRGVALGGATAAFIAAWTAYHAPFPREIHALMPVLRSNFWLGIHVLTIVSSYAGALTAWAIGNVSLAIYLFGTYRLVPVSRKKVLGAANGDVAGDNPASPFGISENQSYERRPPAICGSLASLNYRVIQVTVLLLTAGTILGGLWADVSWGRFWGWDPKETWALNSLLIYLIVLHGRRAGWPGDLSLAAGSIVGFASIWWAWYGVNFLMATGLHAYGGDGAGQWWLGLLVIGNLAFMVAAVVRAVIETSRPQEGE
jgi:ABC-type transport system involved in cytochrome c biogenesis permease subunit